MYRFLPEMYRFFAQNRQSFGEGDEADGYDVDAGVPVRRSCGKGRNIVNSEQGLVNNENSALRILRRRGKKILVLMLETCVAHMIQCFMYEYRF
jgi:hypothetical protein